MTNKDTEMMRIVDNTIQCCAVLDNEGHAKLTKETVLGRCRRENVQMVRTLLVTQIIAAGFTISTVADLLHRTPQAIRHMCDKAYFLSKTSRAYRMAEAEATMLNKAE